MSTKLIHTFQSDGDGLPSIGVRVFITGLPPNSSVTVHSHVDYSCSWFVCYSVQSHSGRTEYFYENIKDSNESSDYVLNILYDSTRAICSFDSSDQLTFVSGDNEVLVEQDQPTFYEYRFQCENDNADYKLFLVIYKNRIVLFWHDYYAKVIVKTLYLSSFDSFEGFDFTRVDTDITPFDCFSLTFYTEPSCYNTYYSLYVSSESILDSKDVNYVCREHTFDIPCDSALSGSQFIPDTDVEFRRGILRMDSIVDGKLQEDDSDVGSDDSDVGSDDSDVGSDDSEDDY
jgi:hypothetical protein